MRAQLGKSSDDAFWQHVEKLYAGSPSHGKSNLRLRWLNVINPALKRTAWTANEDAALLQCLNTSAAASAPFDWVAAAAAVTAAAQCGAPPALLPPSRTAADCLMRCANASPDHFQWHCPLFNQQRFGYFFVGFFRTSRPPPTPTLVMHVF